MNDMVRITSRDMVAVALKPLRAGETVSFGGGEIALLQDLPMGHKAALRDIRKGEAEKFAMAGFLVPHVSQKRWGRMHCHSKKFAIFAGRIALHAIFSGACSVVKT